MRLTDLRNSSVVAPPRMPRGRARRTRLVSEFEGQIRQLYRGVMDEPVPSHLLAIVRTRLQRAKS